MSLLLALLVIGSIAFVVHLDRRLGKLERRIDEGPSFATVEQWSEPEPAPVSGAPLTEWAPPEPAILDAEGLASEPGGAEPQFPQPDPEADPEAERSRWFAFSIEDLFGRRLPIWAGGVTLAIAGFLIVKLSIEAGLLSPPVRVIGGTIFGVVLIGAAEAALRFHYRVGDVRVRQALSGAGLATLYASILVAANLYHLIPALAGMLAIAAVTGAAMLLSIRFGAPSALLGLAGGLAAPALIGSTAPNVPMLSLYLALAVGGLAALSRNQRWAWLGISALVGGFGWGVVLLLGGALDTAATLSLGLYILLLGVALPALRLAEGHSGRLQLVAGIVAAAQIAALVATGGFTMLNWGLFAAIAAAMVWLAAREPSLAPLPDVGLVIALFLAAAWPAPHPREFALVLTGIALINGVMPLRRLWSERGTLLEAGQLAAIALGSWIVAMFQFHAGPSNDTPLGLLALGLSLGLGAVGFFGWSNPRRDADARFAIVAIAAALLLAGASSLLPPYWLSGVAIAAIGLGVLHLGQIAEDRHFEPVAWIFAAAGLIAFVWPDASLGNVAAVDSLRCALMAGIAAMFAWRGRFGWTRATAQFAAPILLYFALTPWISDRFEPLVPAAMIITIAWTSTRLRNERLTAAMASTMLISVIWAIEPLNVWLAGATMSLVGEPMLLSSVPATEPALLQMLLPGAAIGAAAWLASARPNRPERVAGLIIAAIIAAIGLHSLYKQVFALTSAAHFVALGLAERTVWEVLLAAGAVLAWRFRQAYAALLLAGASALHFAIYTLVLHNPLWAPQEVGTVPIFNLLLPAYGLSLVLLALTASVAEGRAPILRRAIAVFQIMLITLLGFSLLRQAFHGTLLVQPGLSQFEDIARSIVAIGLGIGFLLWGISRKDRDWRIASLVLMVAAVAKVFLFDASGLEGVTRIASFIALGLSLIGIGWLYSRYLPEAELQLAKAGSSL